jgi:hypothetical protein
VMLEEVQGDVVTPGSVEQLSGAMTRGLSAGRPGPGPAIETQLVVSKMFTWKRAALEYAALYEFLLSEAPVVNG